VPDLLTLRGLSALQQCSVVYALPPYAESYNELLVGKTIFDPFNYFFSELLERVEAQLSVSSVAFLVPGDQTFFCPYQGIIDGLGERAVVIPGVGVANAASALLKKTLDLPLVCERTLIVSPRLLAEQGSLNQLVDYLDPKVSLLLYMNHLPLKELAALLRKGYGEDVPLAVFYRLGLNDEDVLLSSLDEILASPGHKEKFNPPAGTAGHSSSLLFYAVGHSLCAKGDAHQWDKRRAGKTVTKGN